MPANCNKGMIPSGYEENCVKSNSQIRILGVCRGWEAMPKNVQDKTTRVRPSSELGCREKKWLKEFVSGERGAAGDAEEDTDDEC